MKRTPQQNNALHLGFRILAESLNDSGSYQKKVLTGTDASEVEAVLVDAEYVVQIIKDNNINQDALKSAVRVFEFLAKLLRRLHKDIPWSEEMVKENLFKTVERAMLGKASTQELERLEVSQVWDVMMNMLAETVGQEYIPIPSDE